MTSFSKLLHTQICGETSLEVSIIEQVQRKVHKLKYFYYMKKFQYNLHKNVFEFY